MVNDAGVAVDALGQIDVSRPNYAPYSQRKLIEANSSLVQLSWPAYTGASDTRRRHLTDSSNSSSTTTGVKYQIEAKMMTIDTIRHKEDVTQGSFLSGSWDWFMSKSSLIYYQIIRISV